MTYLTGWCYPRFFSRGIVPYSYGKSRRLGGNAGADRHALSLTPKDSYGDRPRLAEPSRGSAGGSAVVIKYILRKIFEWAIMLVLATNFTYFLANGFLSPRSMLENKNTRTPPPPEQIDRQLSMYNLNDKDPILQRWARWARDICFHWDWGKSHDGQAVGTEIASRIWVSASLLLAATALAVILGVALGVYTASRQYKFADRFFQFTSILAMNVHIIVMALAVVIVGIAFNNWAKETFGLTKPPFYVTGAGEAGVEGILPKFIDWVRHVTLPTIALLVINIPGWHFQQRALLLDNIAADYVRTARAKGLTKAQAVRKHALRTSIIPIATAVAFSIPGIFTGAFISERIFAWRGMGLYYIDAVNKNNIHGVVGVSAFSSLMTAIGAILSDIFVVFVDPRVRVS